MTNEEIKELLQIFNESGVGELELQRGRDRLRIRRAGESAAGAVHAPAPITAAPAALPVAEVAKAPEADSGHVLVKSPIVGTYYDAPSPGRACLRQGRRPCGARPGAVHHRVHEADE